MSDIIEMLIPNDDKPVDMDINFIGEIVRGADGKDGKDGRDGYNVVVFDTHIRNYTDSGWKSVGTKGYNTDWGDVANRKDFKVGDIGILIGHNTTTNSPVMLIGKITDITTYMVWMTSIACIQGLKGAKGDTGSRGPQGPQGPDRLVQYYKYRDNEVDFKLEKGHIYAFTVKDENTTSVSIVDTNGKTVTGVAGETLSGLKNGMVVCADRCLGGGLTGRFSILNLNALKTDKWDWDDGSRNQYGPYRILSTNKDGVDIWKY